MSVHQTTESSRLAERASVEAELLRRRRRPDGGSHDRIAAQPRTGDVQRFPTTPEQKSTWLREHLDPWPGARNIPDSVRVRGPLRLDLLELAINDLVARQESLRTTFELVGDQLEQVVRPQLSVPLDLVETMPDRFSELVCELGSAPFDLAAGPLIRAVLLRAAPDDSVLLISVHHIVTDGQSSEILIAELTELYRARLHGEPAMLAPLAIQQADYAAWRKQRLTGPRHEELVRYWQAKLAGLPATRLPADLPAPRRRSWMAGNFLRALPAELPERVLRFAAARHTTEFLVYLAAFNTTLATMSGDRDFAVQVPTLGRLRPEIEPLIGCFYNTVLVRTELAGQPSFGQTVDRLSEQFVQDLAHAELPLGEQFAIVEPPPGEDGPPSGSHLVQLLFGIDRDQVPELGKLGLSFEPVHYLLPFATRELNVRVLHSPPGTMMVIRYADERYSPARVEELYRRFCTVLEEGLADPDRCLLGESELLPVPIVDERPVAPAEPDPGPVPAHWLAEAIQAWTEAVRRCRPGSEIDPGSLGASSRLFDTGDRVSVVAFAQTLAGRFGVPVAARELLAAATLGGVARLLAALASDRPAHGRPAVDHRASGSEPA